MKAGGHAVGAHIAFPFIPLQYYRVRSQGSVSLRNLSRPRAEGTRGRGGVSRRDPEEGGV